MVVSKKLSPTCSVKDKGRGNSSNEGHVGKRRMVIRVRLLFLPASISFFRKNDKLAIISIAHTLGPDPFILFKGNMDNPPVMGAHLAKRHRFAGPFGLFTHALGHVFKICASVS